MQEEKQDQKEQVVHRGLYIANERRKRKGGRIKSMSIDNKIEVFDDFELLHESEVQWVEQRRYDRNQRKNTNKNPKKEEKKGNFIEKKNKSMVKGKKYKLKEIKEEGDQKKSIQKDKEEPQKQKEVQQQQGDRIEKNSQKTLDKDAQQTSFGGEQEKKQVQQENDKKQKKNHDQKKQEDGKNSEDDGENEEKQKQQIVIVAKITKQISNPFWDKPFVGIMRFAEINKNRNKFQEKGEQISHIRRIMKDFYFDVQPIHVRLPHLEIIRSEQAEKKINDYIRSSLKIDWTKKGGVIRNKIMDELQETYVLVKFQKWDDGFLQSSLIKVIGKARTIDGECNCFLHEHGLDGFEHSYPEEEVKTLEIQPTPDHKPTNRLVFTIDPQTSTDLDDALSIEQLSETTYEIGIHIADLTSYLQYIDRQQISKRTTSVYLPHTTFHMLPKHILKVCSLDPEVDRLAFTIYVEMNVAGEVIGECRIEKSIIQSRYKFSYDTVQNILTGKITFEQFNQLHPSKEEEFLQVAKKLGQLARIGLAHREKRILFEVFENRELKFTLDQQKWPIDCVIESRFKAQKLVEEYMIIGNVQAARFLIKNSPDSALVIHHPPPSALAIKQFKQYFKQFELDFNFDDIKKLEKDLFAVSKLEISEQIKQLCFFKARRVQQVASYKKYSDIEQGEDLSRIHFALGMEFYTHFTSPMRRMADIIVHQTLNKLIKKEEPAPLDKKEIQMVNWGRTNTKRLKRDLNEMYLCLVVYRKKSHFEAEAVVVSFGLKSISLYIPTFQLQKEVMWEELNVVKAIKNRKNEENIDVCLHKDKKNPKKNLYWRVQKMDKIKVMLGCTKELPLRLSMDLEVKTTRGFPQKILSRNYYQ